MAILGWFIIALQIQNLQNQRVGWLQCVSTTNFWGLKAKLTNTVSGRFMGHFTGFYEVILIIRMELLESSRVLWMQHTCFDRSPPLLHLWLASEPRWAAAKRKSFWVSKLISEMELTCGMFQSCSGQFHRYDRGRMGCIKNIYICIWYIHAQ